MKIGIIGSGIAGLTTGYLLRKQNHDVTIFDKKDRIGYDYWNIILEENYLSVPSRIIGRKCYPLMMQLLEELNIECVQKKTTFQYDDSYFRLITSSLKLKHLTKKLLSITIDSNMTFGNLIDNNKMYGKTLAKQHIMRFLIRELQWVLNCSANQVKNYPAKPIIDYLIIHLTTPNNTVSYIKDPREFVAKLSEGVLFVSDEITSITENNDFITLNGGYDFDHVIVATEAHIAYKLLPFLVELSYFELQDVQMIIHTDSTVLKDKTIDMYSNRDKELHVIINNMYNLKMSQTYIETYNPVNRIDPEKILHNIQFTRPIHSIKTIHSLKRFTNFHPRIHLCGSYTVPGLCLQEEAILSAYKCVEEI